jgi:glycosyltransferase involved in cell wall biosynthesis
MDVCLILEGTYPYVSGGVSSCVYQLIKNTPEIKYHLVFIGPTPDDYTEMKYEIPDNVVSLKEVYLFDYELEGELVELGPYFNKNVIHSFHEELKKGEYSLFIDIFKKIFSSGHRPFNPMDILRSKEAWDILEKHYNTQFDNKDNVSFVDYFYTWRFIHFPIFKLLMADIPMASIYHSMCTGYAGLYGVAAKLMYDKPLVLTEHGIYTNEREIEISQADWVYQENNELDLTRSSSFFKSWWINIFKFMGKLTYDMSDTITTLYYGNMQKQISYGADQKKIKIFPNGVNLKRFKKVVKKLKDRNVIALIGRVVPIKDIKSFIKAVNILLTFHPDTDIWILGPTDEDKEYFEECVMLSKMLGIEDRIVFKGKVNLVEYFSMIDLIVLSSISEGQPIVILEAFACSIPVISTDVGACRELIYGMTEDDKKLGKAGEVVPFGRPDLLAEEIGKLLTNPDNIKKLGKIGNVRVNKYYTEEIYINNYLSMYKKMIR